MVHEGVVVSQLTYTLLVRVRLWLRAAALFCPRAEEPGRETGPAAMGHPSWGSSMGFV